MSVCDRTVGHEGTTMKNFVKFQKHVPLLKSRKIEYTEMFIVPNISPAFCAHLSGKSLNRFQSVNVFHKVRIPNRYIGVQLNNGKSIAGLLLQITLLVLVIQVRIYRSLLM